MPVLQHADNCPSPDIPSAELLYRHSINSLLGLQGRSGPSEGDTLMSISNLLGMQPRQQLPNSPRICIPPTSRNSQNEDFPNSPEGGLTPRSIMPQYFPPRNVSAFGSYSEVGSGLDRVLAQQHRSTPDSDNLLSSPSPTPNIDNSITELMNCLSLMPQSSSRFQAPNYNGFRELRERADSSSMDDVKCRWYGTLPPRRHSPSGGFSPKVFLGGLPWDITESTLVQAFQPFGQIRVEWPRKEQSAVQPKGYVYVIFESERQVRSLLEASTYDPAGNWYYRLSSKKMRSKEVQIIPWALDDSNYVKSSSVKLDPSRTVFVGALHGMLSAEGLAKIMNELFNGVVYAGIDTDKHKYPIGSGRVTFNNSRSYMRAVSAAFVEIKTEKFFKKVQVDPYIEDSMCSICNVQQGPYFCRDPKCFRYFCRSCWYWQHAQEEHSHKPLMRHSRSCGGNGLSGHSGQGHQQLSQSPTPSVSSGCGSNNAGSNNHRFKKMYGGVNWNYKNIK